MREFSILIYEDSGEWVDGFVYNISPKLEKEGVRMSITHRIDTNSVAQDLVRCSPHLVMVDDDLDEYAGEDVLMELDGNPDMVGVSVYYFSGGESIEGLRRKASQFHGIHCYLKQGNEIDKAVYQKGLLLR